MVRWTCPDGIGNIAVELDNWTCLHKSQFDGNLRYVQEIYVIFHSLIFVEYSLSASGKPWSNVKLYNDRIVRCLKLK